MLFIIFAAVFEQIVMDFINVIDYIGTFAFAISGIRLAAAKKFDWFGAYVVGFVTAVGGGTLRDLMLGVTPFWMEKVSYVIITAIALLFVIVFRRHVVRLDNTFFIFDAIGLGLFTVVGVEKSLDAGYPVWVNMIMGMITGSAGGMMRDIFINEIPLIFRKDIYAMACVAGACVYYLCYWTGCSHIFTQLAGALTVILTRVLSVYYGISLPSLRGVDERHEEGNGPDGSSHRK